jgi:hypothetical protein
VSITAVSGSAGATTLTTPQIPSHTHTYSFFLGSPAVTPSAALNPGNYNPSQPNSITTNATGGGGSHTHPFSFSSGSGTFTGDAINLAVKYYDFIIASID